ncbi:MAG TPA: hypothetical protein PLQ81_13315, partial [bacterium]|nr:hypothetical protein [bacterium]
PEAVLAAAPKTISLNVVPLPKTAILYSEKLRLPEMTKRGNVILESSIAGGIHLRPIANENIQILAGGSEINITAGISSGEAVIPEGFPITIKYTDIDGASYKTENITLKKLADILPENALAAGTKYPVSLAITPVPPVAVLYSGKIKISPNAKDGKIALECVESGAGIIQPISGLNADFGMEIGVAAVISNEGKNVPDALNINVKYIDKNGVSYTTEQPAKIILVKLPEILPFATVSISQKSVEINTVQKKSAIQFTGDVIISKDIKKGKVKLDIINAPVVFIKPADNATAVPGEKISIQAVISNLEYTNQIPMVSVTYYDDKDAAYAVTDQPVNVRLTKSTVELPFDVISTGKNPVYLTPVSVSEKIYKYAGILNIPADFKNEPITPDKLKPTVSIDGKGIISVTFDAASGAEEYTIKWQFSGNAEASKLVTPVNNNTGKQTFRVDNLAGDGNDEIKMKPKFTSGSFVEGDKIRLEWGNTEQYIDVWVTAKIKAAEPGSNKIKTSVVTTLTKGFIKSAPEGDIVSENPVTSILLFACRRCS